MIHLNQSLIYFLHRSRVLHHLSVSTRVRYGAGIFTIPIVRGVGYSHCVGYEHWLFNLLRRLKSYLANDKSFVDVGVNIGQSLLIAKSLYPKVRYAGFEPNPVCVEYTSRLINMNGIQDARLYPFGLSSETGNADLIFFHPNADDSTASVVHGFRTDEIRKRSTVSLVRGDEIKDWASIRPGIIKVDVEGAELEVLSGLKEVVEEYRPPLICEVLPVYSTENEFRVHRQSSLLNMLSSYRYTLYHIDEAGSTRRIDGFQNSASIDCCNYLFLPSESTLTLR